MRAPITAQTGESDVEQTRRKLIIFDNDNFFTDAWEGGAGYIAKYPRIFASELTPLLGRNAGYRDVHRMFNEQMERVLSDSSGYPMKDTFGRVVTHAMMDVNVFIRVVAGLVLDTLGVLQDSSREPFLHLVHTQCFEARPVFRDHAAYILEFWMNHNQVHTHIVTGSPSSRVVPSITQMLGYAARASLVIGDAKKHVITTPDDHDLSSEDQAAFTPMWKQLERTQVESNGPNLLYPHRGHFYRVLTTLRHKYSLDWTDIICAGDSWSCDGLLVSQLGGRFFHLQSTHTPAWEVADVNASHGCRSFTTLEDLHDALCRTVGA